MPSSSPPNVDNSATGHRVMQPAFEHGVLRMNVVDAAYKMAGAIVPLQGKCPDERPYFSEPASLTPDIRRVSPLTVRFKEQGPGNLCGNGHNHDAVRAALWNTLSDLMAGCTAPQDLPRVVFHEGEGRDSGTPDKGLFDLVFPSVEALRSVATLKEVNLGGFGSDRRVFSRTLATNALPSDIFVIDCLNFPLEQSDGQALFAALKDMTAGFGSLVGVGKIVVQEKGWQLDTHALFSGTIRFYVKLSRASMVASLQDLVAQIPSHLLWFGTPLKLYFSGCDLQTQTKHSADYPLSSSSPSELSASTASSSTQTGTEEGETPSGRKKRKASTR